MAGHQSVKAIFYALGANFGIAVAKGVAAAVTRSSSMLAETIHSIADCANQGLLLLGMKRSQIPPSAAHPLGHGMVVYFWSFIVAMLLFSIGGLFSIYEGIHKLHAAEPVSQVWVALGVLGVSIVLEGLSLMGALKEIRTLRKGKSFFEWLKHTRSSELVVILGEDVAAVTGLVIAFVFVLLSHLLQMPVLDAVGSICIGVILIIVSIFLIIRIKSLLIGKSADPEMEAAMREFISGDPHVVTLYHLITLQIGPYVMLAGKLKLKAGLPIQDACGIINRLEKRIKAEFPEVKWSFIEPDIAD